MTHSRQTIHAFIAVFAACVGLAGCTQHRVDVQPIRVEPIHLTIDVNVRVDRELDQFFDYEREAPAPAETVAPPVETVPPPVDPVPTPEVPPGS